MSARAQRDAVADALVPAPRPHSSLVNGSPTALRNESNTRKREVTQIIVANTDGSGEPVAIAERKSPDFFSELGPSWSPDGKIIACGAGSLTGDGRRTVVGVPAQGGAETRLTSETWTEIGRVLWLGDGSGLITTAKAEQSDNGTQIWQLSYPGGATRRITNDLNAYGDVSLGIAADSSS